MFDLMQESNQTLASNELLFTEKAAMQITRSVDTKFDLKSFMSLMPHALLINETS